MTTFGLLFLLLFQPNFGYFLDNIHAIATHGFNH